MEPEYIKHTVATYFGISERELESNQPILGPKYITIYFLRVFTDMKWRDIAEMVYYKNGENANRVSKLVIKEIKNNPNFARTIDNIESKLRLNAAQHILS